MGNTKRVLAGFSFVLALTSAGCAGSGLGDDVRKDVEARMASAQEPINACYQAALTRNRRAAGGMTLAFVAQNGSGKFTSVKVQQSELNDPELDRCVTEQVTALKLAKPTKTNISVTYPITFIGED